MEERTHPTARLGVTAVDQGEAAGLKAACLCIFDFNPLSPINLLSNPGLVCFFVLGAGDRRLRRKRQGYGAMHVPGLDPMVGIAFSA